MAEPLELALRTANTALEVAIQVYTAGTTWPLNSNRSSPAFHPAMRNARGLELWCPRRHRRSFPRRLERRESPAFTMPCSRSRKCHVQRRAVRFGEAACHRGIGRFVPQRHTCDASAGFVSVMAVLQPQKSYPRFTPTCGPCAIRNKFLHESYHLGPANWQRRPFAEAIGQLFSCRRNSQAVLPESPVLHFTITIPNSTQISFPLNPFPFPLAPTPPRLGLSWARHGN